MNTIGIDHNLDRARIRKLLTIGLFASVLTGIGDFLLGYAESTAGSSLATSVMASAPNLTNWQMIIGRCSAEVCAPLPGRDLRLYLDGSGRLPSEHGHPEPGL